MWLPRTPNDCMTTARKPLGHRATKAATNSGDQDRSTIVHEWKPLATSTSRDAGLDFQLVSGDAVHNSDFWLIADKAGIGARFTFDIDPRSRPEAHSIVQRFRAVGYEPEGYTIHTYAALQVWVQAVEKAGTVDSGEVAKVMHQQSFDTVLGNLSFDEKGDLTQHAFAWYQWQEGKPVRQ